MLENVPSGIFVKDARSLRLVRVNRAIEESLDATRDEMIGRRVEDLLSQSEVTEINAEHAVAAKAFSDPRHVGWVRIATSWDAVASEVRIEVQDNGLGMSPETVARAFEAFFTTKRSDEGTGLGLCITQSIVTDHGGRLEIDTSTGAGTTMIIGLPHRERASVCGASDRAASDGQRGRVLVVDDEQIVRDLLADVLRGRGHEVVMAADGLAAIRHVQRCADAAPFDVVLTDIRMPKMTGIELLEACCDNGTATVDQFVIMTGALISQEVLALERRGARIMVKPFHVREVNDLVAQTLLSRTR